VMTGIQGDAELLAEVVGRYGVILHAYVLMENHYHLLIETSAGNASRALQWLNLSYSMWFKARHHLSGSLFQARFKSVPVDGEGSWALTCSVYIHLNPVRVKALGLGKEDRKRERADAKADYRSCLEDYLRRGVEEGAFARITAAVAQRQAYRARCIRQSPPGR